MFTACLANGPILFILTDELKMFYYRGLPLWPGIKGFLLYICLTAQNQYKMVMEKLGIVY